MASSKCTWTGWLQPPELLRRVQISTSPISGALVIRRGSAVNAPSWFFTVQGASSVPEERPNSNSRRRALESSSWVKVGCSSITSPPGS